MTSGEPGQGRTCLKGNEIDPDGLAKPCITPTPSISVVPTVAPITKLPTVGMEWQILLPLIFWLIVMIICAWYWRKY